MQLSNSTSNRFNVCNTFQLSLSSGLMLLFYIFLFLTFQNACSLYCWLVLITGTFRPIGNGLRRGTYTNKKSRNIYKSGSRGVLLHLENWKQVLIDRNQTFSCSVWSKMRLQWLFMNIKELFCTRFSYPHFKPPKA